MNKPSSIAVRLKLKFRNKYSELKSWRVVEDGLYPSRIGTTQEVISRDADFIIRLQMGIEMYLDAWTPSDTDRHFAKDLG